MSTPHRAKHPIYSFLQGLNDSKTAMINGRDSKGRPVYAWEGNTDFHSYTKVPNSFKIHVPIIWFEEKDRQVVKPDIFINCIADADVAVRSLARATALIEASKQHWPGVPIFNDPSKIPGTRRDLIYKDFHTLPGIDIPMTIRIQPKSPADLLALAEKAGMPFPFIARPCGSHMGRGLVYVESPKNAKTLHALPYDGSSFYVTEFRDFKGADGLYTKSRFIVMDDRIFPRHSITATSWKIHAGSREELMEKSPKRRKIEEKELATMEQRISPAARESVLRIFKDVGLDYLGYDCNIRPDGTVLFFEINAAQNAMAKSDYKVFPYLRKYGEDLIDGYNACLARKLVKSNA